MTDTSNKENPVGLETRNIFLDTEVFRSNSHNLNTKIMKILGSYVAEGIFVLHTTDVTLREISSQIGAMESDLTNRANKIAKELKHWNSRYRFYHHHLPVPDPLNEPAQPSNAFSDFETILCNDWNAQVHRAANLPIGPVLDQYFNRQPPFDKEGSKEFPDAIALHALQHWCAHEQESIYVISRDKAVQRAADERDHLIAIDSLERLFDLLIAQDHDIAETISAAFDELPLIIELQDALSENISYIGGLYDGDKYDGDVLAMEIIELEEIENLAVLRVAQNQVSCIAQVKLLVSAEICYEDLSGAMWDKEDNRYLGGETVVTEIQDSITTKIFVDLSRDDDEITLSSAQFIAQDLTVTDYFDDGYPYK